VIKTFQVVV